MKTIEDKLQAAYELGRIVGAAECFADEDVRNTVCGAAHTLFDGLLAEAAEEAKASREKTEALIHFSQNYPPDPFDFVETGEMVEKEPAPMRTAAQIIQDATGYHPNTNFTRITKSPEALATFMNDELDRCPPKVKQIDCADNTDCMKCWTDWLNEEATPDD